jgi:hypothetical protein
MLDFPIMTSGWVTNLRAVLELLYFVADIAIAFFAALALKQITLTKRIATASAKRESLKFAAERCQYYAERCSPLLDAMVKEHDRQGLTFFKTPTQFSIVEGEIITTNLNIPSLVQQYAKMPGAIVDTLNSLEAFAIPFAAGVADDDLGFQETGSTFCKLVDRVIAMIVVLRKVGDRYESTIKVYDRWKSRLVAQDLEGKMKKMQQQHKTLAEKGKINATEPY